MGKTLIQQDLGRASYADALAVQRRWLERLQADPAEPARLILVEHDPPVVTFGRRAREENLIASSALLEARGVEVHESQRGGDVTYHGPGQLVAYPIVRLDPRRRSVHGYVRDLEETLIALLATYGVDAGRRSGLTGVWVGEEKVAAIGVAVSRWVAYHGVALNVAEDLSGFDLIVPCGIRDHGVTSLARLLGRPVEMEEVKRRFIEAFCEVFGYENGGEERKRLAPWLRRTLAAGGNAAEVHGIVKELGLATVCSDAHCPNQAECFERRTATFMILGRRCTRNCRFCAIESAEPPDAVREDEPEAVAEACARLGLRHVVVTSVTRDDLADGGAGQFARVCRAVRERLPEAVIEILTPDFQGDPEAVALALSGEPDVFNHNVETVPRLYIAVRPEADYDRSLRVLETARRHADGHGGRPRTKSGLMVGLGETRDELRRVMADLRGVGCDALTIGQYLAPSRGHHPVVRFVPPEEFAEMKAEAEALGFRAVAAGPFVRSSYRADEVFQEGKGEAEEAESGE